MEKTSAKSNWSFIIYEDGTVALEMIFWVYESVRTVKKVGDGV